MNKLKVCAYCRVSTNSRDQANSFENQKSYFEREIQKNPNYQLIDIYADRGLSGTKLKRPEFDRMLYDAGLDTIQVLNEDRDKRKNYIKYVCIASTSRQPKFNLIMVKNTSRFARNVLVEDILRELKKNGVYVHFLDLDKSTENEDDITYIQIFQSFDERDSRDKSKKVRFGFEEGIKKGIIHTNSKLYGYRYIQAENRLEINDEEAKVVRLIFDLCLKGYGARRTIDYLTSRNIYTRQGKPFVINAVKRILSNEKYAGLNNRGKYDTGIVFNKNSYPKVRDEYDIQETDKIPAIIDIEIFNKCQELKKKNLHHIKQVGKYSGLTPYASKIICNTCGGNYISNVDNGRQFYNCTTKKRFGIKRCNSVNINKDTLDKLIIDQYEDMLIDITDTVTDLIFLLVIKKVSIQKQDVNPQEIKVIKQTLEDLITAEEKLVDLYTSNKISKEIYEKKYSNIVFQKNELNDKLSLLENFRDEKNSIIDDIYSYVLHLNDRLKQLEAYKKAEDILGFVNKVTVISKAEVQVEFNLFDALLEMNKYPRVKAIVSDSDIQKLPEIREKTYEILENRISFNDELTLDKNQIKARLKIVEQEIFDNLILQEITT